jgi:DNA-binding winged helix-turn-helix (wHTH) protein
MNLHINGLNRSVDIRQERRALPSLAQLPERPRELVSKRQLMSRVWPNIYVEQVNLTVHIRALRQSPLDGRDGNWFMINVPGPGYSFVASIKVRHQGDTGADEAPQCVTGSSSGSWLHGHHVHWEDHVRSSDPQPRSSHLWEGSSTMHLARSSTRARLATRCTSGNRFEKAEDMTLRRRWRDRHDISATRQIAKRYRHLIVQLAESHRASGLPWDDLTVESQLGLMRALCRCHPDRGLGFTTYVTLWVAFTRQEYVLKNASRLFRQARAGELLCAELGYPPIRRLRTAAKPDLRFRQQTARATEAFNTHRRADDAPCGRI